MSTAATIRTELRDLYVSESARIQQEFAANGSGGVGFVADKNHRGIEGAGGLPG